MTTTITPTAADMADVEEDRSVATLPTATGIDELIRRFRPINDQVLVKLDAAPRMVGLIHIPDTVRDDEAKLGTVVAVGPGAWLPNGRRDTPDFGPGDRVQLGKDPGWELAAGHRVLRAGAVHGVIE